MTFFRRRKYIINKDLQYRLMIISIGYVTAFFVTVSLVLFVPLMMKLDQDTAAFDEEALQTANQILYLHTNLWPIVLIFLIAISLHSIYTSHKIVGPLYRFNLIFKAIKEGNLPKSVHLRTRDYLNSEMEAINDMTETLRSKVTGIQQQQAILNEVFSKLMEMSSRASKDEIMEKIKILTEVNHELGDKLDYFKIE